MHINTYHALSAILFAVSPVCRERRVRRTPYAPVADNISKQVFSPLPEVLTGVLRLANQVLPISFMIVWSLFNFENRNCCYWDVIIYIFKHMLSMYS